ncbi:hypothetical protein ACHAWF_013382 [Thalassiosira exigua]
MADPSAVAGEDAGGSLATRFRSLLRASASILHGVDPSVTDRWIDDVLARRGGGGGGCGGGDAGDGLGDGGGAGGGGGGSGGDGRAVDDDDSSSDGGLMMLGGLHSDSDSDDDDGLGIGLGMDAGDAGGLHDEDDRDDDDDDDDDEDEDDEEDEVALLKRASSVHSALLLSLPPRLAGGRGAVERLVASISRGGAESRDEEGEPDPSLISLLSFVVSSSSLDERPRGVGRAKWRKVCVANALLAVQFSLRLRKNPRDDEGGSLASSLDGWNAVVLPLLFGAGDGSDDAEASLLLTDDSLRDAALDLVPLSSEVVARGDAERGCRTAASLCLDAAERAVRSRKDAAIGSRLVAAACQVLVRLHDGVSKPRVPRAGDAEVAKEGMHRASLALIRGACYATGDGSVEDRTGNASPTPPLRIEALRPVTGALLPTLYPKKSEVDGMGRVDNGNVNSVADERAIELWEEVLRLVDPEVGAMAFWHSETVCLWERQTIEAEDDESLVLWLRKRGLRCFAEVILLSDNSYRGGRVGREGFEEEMSVVHFFSEPGRNISRSTGSALVRGLCFSRGNSAPCLVWKPEHTHNSLRRFTARISRPLFKWSPLHRNRSEASQRWKMDLRPFFSLKVPVLRWLEGKRNFSLQTGSGAVVVVRSDDWKRPLCIRAILGRKRTERRGRRTADGRWDEDRTKDDVATTAATALLCVLLPSFRDLELPVAVDSNHRRRPAFHPGLWTLLRNCLGRCGDSEVGGGDDFGNGGGGRGTSLLARDTTSGDSGELGAAATDRLLRRRAAHALGLLVERERERLLRKGSGNHVAKGKGKAKGKKKGGKRDESIGVGDRARCRADLWTKYVLAFEVLETETEPHLVEQVWPTVAELAAEAGSVADDEGGAADEETLLPRLTWDDVDALLRRVLFSDSPVLRKLGLYRFLSGGAGVDVVVLPDGAMEADEGTPSDPSGRDAESNEAFMKRPKSKGGIKQTRCGPTSLTEPAPLSTVSVPFVLDAIVRSYDSIVGTKVGGNIQVEGDDGRQQSVALADVLSVFFANYVVALAAQGLGERLSEFANGVFGGLIQNHKARTVTVVWRSVATGLECMPPSERNSLRIDPGTVQGAVRSMRAVFSSGGAPRSMQQGLKLDLARALRNSKPWEKPETSVVLRSLAMYPPSDDDEGPADETRARATLGIWLRGLGSGTWASTAAPACASAFVMGQLVPYGEVDVASGSDVAERESGAAICAMCELCEGGSELLWPAVFKGLQRSVPDDASSPGFFRAHRSAILLEFGCKEGILSGMGNGEIVLDENARSAMPPPPKIEALLGNAVRFVLSQLTTMTTTLFATDDEAGGPSGGSTRSSASSGASSYAAMRIGQMRTLIAAYPSSAVLAEAANRMLEECVDALLLAIRDGLESQTGQERTGNPSDVVKRLVLAYAALSCGAVFEGDSASRIVSTCRAVIGLEPSVPAGIRKGARQACRSIFHYAKWGTLSLIVPMLAEGATALDEEVQSVRQAVLNDARGSVDATPAVALPPLFECALETGRHIVGLDGKTTSLLSSLQTIVETLFAVLEEDSSSSNWLEMLDRTCQLIFREKLLLEEYEPYSKSDRAAMPVRQAFENLLKMAGATKPHIAKAAVSRISSAWLGPEDDVGLCAIPYREHIVDLLVYKECKFDENAAHQARESWDTLPESTNGSSITRAFVLLFLSKLPPLEDMSAVVREELVHFVIRKLMDVCCVQPAQGKAFISGSDEYARFMRAWQALCLLSRYVTKDIAGEVAARAFSAMTWNLHGQLRYFIEVFVIQCTRIHPSIFGAVYIREIRRNDLSLQHVSSLMIIGGNLTVGRYSNEFFRSPADPKIKDIVCGVLPWLSSTQGFSRAIAQLLCHKLIPLVVDVEADAPTGSGVNDDSVLRSVYSFLEDNADMSRLRKKQQLFFESYDVDSVCSFEGLLRIPVDEGEEANPLHMVDSIKDCLAEVYKEAHDEDAPIWKQMEDLLIEADAARQSESPDDDGLEGDQDGSQLVNFQRKILPIDLLDLGLKSFQQQKLLNAAGKRKQSLVVCASLIDKVPNLAGLARTCEIFSARLLVLPNLLIRKQDDFKSISASANDWIDMIECKEEDLMPWLQEKKSEGYSVIGLEQTASSKCLTKMDFPDKTVLLLGKEKEGIPIEFLSAVDQCVEIPQLGIIRSLNVHVSGAITIWEYTKQMMQKKKARKAR